MPTPLMLIFRDTLDTLNGELDWLSHTTANSDWLMDTRYLSSSQFKVSSV